MAFAAILAFTLYSAPALLPQGPGQGPPNGNTQDYVQIIGPRRFVKDPELQVGGFGPGINQLGGADTVKVDRQGRIHVIDDAQNLVKVYPSNTNTGEAIEIIDSAAIEAAGFGPLGELLAMTVDRSWANWGPRSIILIDRDTNRTPEVRILRRFHGPGHPWQQLAFTDFNERPRDVIVDPVGRIIIAEKNGSIDVLHPDGATKVSSFANNGTLQLETFDGLEVDDFKAIDMSLTGRIFVADKDNGRILAISFFGQPLFSIGSQGEGEEQFREQVEGVAVDRWGIVYGRDESGDRFLAFAPNGTFLAAFGERGFDPKQQENADEFYIDKRRDRIYIADDGNYRASVHKLRPGAFWSKILTEYTFPQAPIVQPIWIAGGAQGPNPGTEFDEPNELGFDAQGRVWAGDVFNLRVQVYGSDGTFVDVVGGSGSGPGQFIDATSGKSGPEAIKLDSQGRMFVVDRGGQRINVYNGATLAVIGSYPHPLFDDPTGMAIDSADNIYVADQGTDLVHKFTFDGSQLNFVMTLQAEDGGESILSKTETLALDEGRDRLYASSENESRAEVFVLSTGDYLDEHVGERQVGVVAQDGRFADDIEGLDTDTVNDLIIMSDEANGRFIVHDLSSDDLFDNDEDFAFIGGFGRVGGAPGEFLSADGVAILPGQDLVVIADQGNYRIQAFRISDILAAFSATPTP